MVIDQLNNLNIPQPITSYNVAYNDTLAHLFQNPVNFTPHESNIITLYSVQVQTLVSYNIWHMNIIYIP